jgi:hypothetical protein
MKEYHKIETLFKREETGTHRLLIGQFRNSTIEQCKDLEWVFTEKIDGTNIRIHWDGHKVSFNGRTDKAQLHADLWKYISAKFCTPEVEQIFEQKFGDKEVYIFGEGYGAGIQKGGGYSKEKKLIIFDVQVGNTYLKYEDVGVISEIFNVEIVPISLKGTIQQGIDYILSTEKSLIGDGTQPLEGVVGRIKEDMFDRFGNRMIVKIKREDFKFIEPSK